jgi:hypothetical protein
MVCGIGDNRSEGETSAKLDNVDMLLPDLKSVLGLVADSMA